MSRLPIVALALLAACGGAAPQPAAPADSNPHRHLSGTECGALYDFLKEHAWLPEPGTTRDTIVKSCLESPAATLAYYDCITSSTTKEEADHCE